MKGKLNIEEWVGAAAVEMAVSSHVKPDDVPLTTIGKAEQITRFSDILEVQSITIICP